MTTAGRDNIKSAAFLPTSHLRSLQSHPTEITLDTPHKRCISAVNLKTSVSQSHLWRIVRGSTHEKLSICTKSTSNSQTINTINTCKQKMNIQYALERPLQLNMLERIDRLKSKHQEKEIKFQAQALWITKKNEKSRQLKEVGLKNNEERGTISAKIKQLLQPWEHNRMLSEQRFEKRLLRIRKP